MQKGIKFRICLNREQQKLVNQTLGCCRLIYNKGLDMQKLALRMVRKQVTSRPLQCSLN